MLSGIKADADRAKQAVLEAGKDYNPAIPGVGAAWSHNFLNQKPWHPLNYRNQVWARARMCRSLHAARRHSVGMHGK